MVVARRLLRDPHGAAPWRERSVETSYTSARALAQARDLRRAVPAHVAQDLLRVRAEAERPRGAQRQSLSDMRQGTPTCLRVPTTGLGSSTRSRARSGCGSSARSRLVAAVKAATPAACRVAVALLGRARAGSGGHDLLQLVLALLARAAVAQRGSLASSGRPIAAREAVQAASSTASATQRSSPAARKTPCGAVCGRGCRRAPGAAPFIVVRPRSPPEHGHRRLHWREVDVLALAGARAVEECRSTATRRGSPPVGSP